MATVTITFEDGEEGAFSVQAECNPPIPEGSTATEDLSPAQYAAYLTLNYVDRVIFALDEEDEDAEEEEDEEVVFQGESSVEAAEVNGNA